MGRDPETLRALIVDMSTRLGGASVRVLGLLRKLPSGQAALAGLSASPVTLRARSLGLEVYAIASHKADPRSVHTLAELIRTGGFDIVDTQNPQSKLWGSLAAARTDSVLVSTLNSWYEDEHPGSIRGRLYQDLERATSRKVDLFIAVSPEIRRRLLADGVPDEAIALISNAVEVDTAALPGSGAWLRRTFNLPEQSLVCCAVGRLVEAKGYEYLISAMDHLASRQPDLHCLIIGDGRLRESLTDQIARLGLADRVHLLGLREHEETLRIVGSSDMFAMPSVSEGTPVALLEAAALARPIVATRAGGIPDLVTHEEHAILVNVGDSAALAAGMVWVSDHPEEATRLGSRAQQHVMRNFRSKTQAEATLWAYRKAWTRHQMRRARTANPD